MTEGAWNFCPHCGQKIAFTALNCPSCHAPTGRGGAQRDVSPKSYGTAVVLCGIFGTAGIHHFYLGNILHGLFDLALLVATIALFIVGEASGNGLYYFLALLTLCIDGLHTLIVFYRLITEQEHDGHGRAVLHSKN